MTDFRLLSIDETPLRGYTLTVYQPGLGAALTHWLGELDGQRAARRQWASWWKASGHAPPHTDPARPQVHSRPLVFLELTGAATVTAAAIAATGTGWALLAGVPALLAARLADVVATRRSGRALNRLRRTVTDPRDVVEFARAVAARRQILTDWPKLGRLGAADDPRGPLDRALWDLADVMRRRGEVRAAAGRLHQATTDLAADDPVVVQSVPRRDSLAQALQELTHDIADRLGRIENLAAACQQHLADQAAIARARQTTAEADAVLGAVAAERAGRLVDSTGDLADRTAHVLAAYRELRREVITPEP